MSSPSADSPEVTPPNEAIAHLISALDLEDTCQVIQTYLREFDREVRRIPTADRVTQQRIAHSLKSSSAQMGAEGLSKRMAAIEQRLPAGGSEVSADEAASLLADFEQTAAPLRAFVAKHATG
ncbi:MAG: hypothetical protein BroJett029_42750 [Alphaproteobacteria bacterium]|nr:MAG: hypothetical protein BroJett029_42750 [Alphaproteobacteria bacterium]